MNNWLNYLEFASVEFTIEAVTPLLLPVYKGSTFRGAFGNQFKEIVCINRKRDCEKCILSDNCPYYRIFETPNTLDLDWFSSPKLPRPFVLEPPLTSKENFETGEKLKFRIVLIGSAVDYLSYFIFVFDKIGSYTGFGKDRRQGNGRFKICEVRDNFAHNRIIYNGINKKLSHNIKIKTGEELINESDNRKKTAVLTFITPTRIKHNKEYVFFKGNNGFSPDVLINTIYRRLFLLCAGHCKNDILIGTVPDLSKIKLDKVDLSWYDWKRYSSRQDKKQPFGGFVGQVVLKNLSDDFMRVLRIGEITHIGSGTVFGLGKYVITDF